MRELSIDKDEGATDAAAKLPEGAEAVSAGASGGHPLTDEEREFFDVWRQLRPEWQADMTRVLELPAADRSAVLRLFEGLHAGHAVANSPEELSAA